MMTKDRSTPRGARTPRQAGGGERLDTSPLDSILDAKPSETFETFLELCDAAGVDVEIVRAYARETSRYKIDGPPGLERRWYAALDADPTEPDYAIYDTDEYVGEAWNCWATYSRSYLRGIREKLIYRQKPVPDRLAIIDPTDVENVFDLGCGFGFTTLALRQMFPNAARVIGTNVDCAQRRVARRLGRRYGFSVLGGLDKIRGRLAGGVVFASEYFEHFQAPIEHLAEVLDRLEPRVVFAANAFGSRAAGHFDAYEVAGRLVCGADAARAFGSWMRSMSYEKIDVGFWNGRPQYWRLVERDQIEMF